MALLLTTCGPDDGSVNADADPAAAEATEVQDNHDDVEDQGSSDTEAEVQDASDDADTDGNGSSEEDPTDGDDGELATEGLGATQDNPVPLGVTARHGQAAFGQWDITVTQADHNAPMSPDETPGEGRQRVEVSVSFTNRSDSAATPATGLNQSGAADASTEYGLLVDGCAVEFEVEFSDPSSMVEPDGTGDRTMCWYADSANLDSLVVHFAPFYNADSKLWFALD